MQQTNGGHVLIFDNDTTAVSGTARADGRGAVAVGTATATGEDALALGTDASANRSENRCYRWCHFRL